MSSKAGERIPESTTSKTAYERLWAPDDTQLAVAPPSPHAADSIQSMQPQKTGLPQQIETQLLNELVRINKQSRNCCVALFCGLVGFVPSLITCCFAGIVDCCCSGFENDCDFTRTMTQACWECFLPSKIQQQKAHIQSYRKKGYAITKSEENQLLGLN